MSCTIILGNGAPYWRFGDRFSGVTKDEMKGTVCALQTERKATRNKVNTQEVRKVCKSSGSKNIKTDTRSHDVMHRFIGVRTTGILAVNVSNVRHKKVCALVLEPASATRLLSASRLRAQLISPESYLA